MLIIVLYDDNCCCQVTAGNLACARDPNIRDRDVQPRDRDLAKLFETRPRRDLGYVSRPRRRDQDHISGIIRTWSNRGTKSQPGRLRYTNNSPRKTSAPPNLSESAKIMWRAAKPAEEVVAAAQRQGLRINIVTVTLVKHNTIQYE